MIDLFISYVEAVWLIRLFVSPIFLPGDTQTEANGNLCVTLHLTKLHTYHSRFIPEGVAEVSQIFLRGTHVLPKLISYEEHCRRDRW
jgi:hypothetical protein